jgi:seryl-tRNA synthetase
MLDSRLIRAEPARVRAGLARRGAPADALDRAVELDARWAARDALAEALRLRRRRTSEEIARAKTAPGAPGTDDLERLGRQIAEELREARRDLARLDAERRLALLDLPNLPASDVPEETIVLEETFLGAPPRARRGSGGALTHWDLVKLLALAYPAAGHGTLAGRACRGSTAARGRAREASAGRGFLLWRGQGARLLRALAAFMLDVHARDFGYEEVRCPSVATREALEGSAHLPGLEEKMYAVSKRGRISFARRFAAGLAPRSEQPAPRKRGGEPAARQVDRIYLKPPSNDTDLFLIPRTEPHLANLFRGQVLDAGALPARFVASGPAFRRESAHGGAKGRGLLRLHEFPTVEVYAFTRPEESEAELARAVEAATKILALLEVPHRRLLRGVRSLSHAAAKTIDLEVWAAGAEQWLGVAALSSFTDYQARRTETRYRAADGKPRLVHTVGGAAVAIPHLVAAILENHQQSDGSVRLPEALRPYMGGLDRLRPPEPPDARDANG